MKKILLVLLAIAILLLAYHNILQDKEMEQLQDQIKGLNEQIIYIEKELNKEASVIVRG